jgi:hypothetical protein
MKKVRNHKQKKRRCKKYQGAAAQSARDKRKNIYNYQSAEDYITDYTENINVFSKQLNSQTCQPNILSAFSGIQDQLTSFKSFEYLLPPFDHISPISAISRNATLAYSGLSRFDTIKDLSSLVIPKMHDLYSDLIPKVTVTSSILSASEEILKSNQNLFGILGANNLSAFNIQANLAKATEYSLFAEKSLSAFNWSEIGSKVGLSDTAKGVLSESFLGLSNDYSELLKSYSLKPRTFVEINPILTKTTPIEFYTGANFLESISTVKEISSQEEHLKKEIQYENEFTLQQYLPKINPGLLNMWKGAIETFNSNNSDKVRQFTVSLRELFGHLMHTLAPDEAIKKWTIDEIYYDKGKPTRRARLHYICRNISNQPFNKFVEKDIQSTIEFIAIFQDGTHSIESGFTQQQLIAMKSKAETTLKFLLEIEFSTNR